MGGVKRPELSRPERGGPSPDLLVQLHECDASRGSGIAVWLLVQALLDAIEARPETQRQESPVTQRT
jgi:hypothetical protein